MRVAILAPFPLHVIPGLEEHGHGGNHATWLPQLNEAFGREAGWEFHWFTVTKQPVPHDPVTWQGNTFHCLPSPARGRIWRAYRPDVGAIHERLESIAPDLVHAWGTEDCYGLAGAASGRRWLLSVQGLLSEYLRRAPMPLTAHLQARYERRVLRAAREMTAESPWAVERVRALAPHARVRHVDYGVQAPFFAEAWAPDPERPAAIFIGTADRRKGLEDAVAAFADPRLAGYELRIAGSAENPLARALQARATPNVRWIGRLTQSETAQALGRAWCLVMPTRADTGPTVVKEARVMGLPVVTTPSGGQSTYVTEGVNGFQLPVGDVPALVEKLALLLGDFALTRKMGAALRDEQRAYFRPERTAEQFLALYRELTA